jgi:uncharacterized protein YdeI (BOF family)
MHREISARSRRAIALVVLGALLLLLVDATALTSAAAGKSQMMSHTSGQFAGPKANKGTVTHTKQNGKNILTLSADFVVPDTPDPHWMLVDSKGKIYLVQKLRIKNDGYNMSIEVPAYVPDVAKVIIWCAWAETNLGEASFAQPVK